MALLFHWGRLSVNDIADMIILTASRRGLEGLTARNIQKLVYFTQLYHLADHGTPAFRQNIKAWVDGPVVPELWHRFKSGRPAEALITIRDIDLGNAEAMIQKHRTELASVTEVVLDFGSRSERENVAITHGHEPWIRARNQVNETVDGSKSPRISLQDMKSFCKEFVREQRGIRENPPRDDFAARDLAFHNQIVSEAEGAALLKRLEAPPRRNPALARLLATPPGWV